MESKTLGMLLMGLGGLVVLVGGLVFWGAFGWFGRLPGDFRWAGERSTIFLPLGSMVLLSVGLSVAANLLRRFF